MKKVKGKRLTKHLDNLVRIYFKKKYGDNPQCYVCGRFDNWFHPKKHPRGIQVGHYISRRYGIVRWDLLNVYQQCSSCNKVHNQNPAPFSLAIVKKDGQQRISYLENKVKNAKGSRMLTSTKRKIQQELEDLTNRL